jgi:hypothetical protein
MKKIALFALVSASLLFPVTTFADEPADPDAEEIIVTAAKKVKEKHEDGGNPLTFVPIAAIASFRGAPTTPATEPPGEWDLDRSWSDRPDPIWNAEAYKAFADLKASLTLDPVVITAKAKLDRAVKKVVRTWSPSIRAIVPLADMVDLATPRERAAIIAAAAELVAALADSNPAALATALDFYRPAESIEGLAAEMRDFANFTRTGRLRPE